MKTIVAMFANQEDAQKSINLLTEKGLDDGISAVFTNEVKDESNTDSYDVENDEENHVLGENETNGLIEPLEGIELNGAHLEIGGDGDVVVAGKISADYEDSSIETDEEEILELDTVLLPLGIEAADLEAYENRIIKAGEVLVTVTPEENYEEIREALGDGNPVLLEELETEE